MLSADNFELKVGDTIYVVCQRMGERNMEWVIRIHKVAGFEGTAKILYGQPDDEGYVGIHRRGAFIDFANAKQRLEEIKYV